VRQHSEHAMLSVCRSVRPSVYVAYVTVKHGWS